MAQKRRRKIDREGVKAAKKELGDFLKTPEGCLEVLDKSIYPGMEYPNPVSIAVGEKMRYFRQSKKWAPYFKKCGYDGLYERLRKKAEDYSNRAKEDFPGEYSWRS